MIFAKRAVARLPTLYAGRTNTEKLAETPLPVSRGRALKFAALQQCGSPATFTHLTKLDSRAVMMILKSNAVIDLDFVAPLDLAAVYRPTGENAETPRNYRRDW